MNSPAPGSRIRSIRAFDKGVARCRTFAVGALLGSTVWLAAGRGRLWSGTALRSDREALGAPALFQGPNPPGSPRLRWATRRAFTSAGTTRPIPSSRISATKLVLVVLYLVHRVGR